MINISGAKGNRYQETIADGENGETVLVHPIFSASGHITCTLIAGGNTGKFQFTTSSEDAITAGTETWQDWDETTDTGTVTDVLAAPVTAVRGVSTSGEVKIELIY